MAERRERAISDTVAWTLLVYIRSKNRVAVVIGWEHQRSCQSMAKSCPHGGGLGGEIGGAALPIRSKMNEASDYASMRVLCAKNILKFLLRLERVLLSSRSLAGNRDGSAKRAEGKMPEALVP